MPRRIFRSSVRRPRKSSRSSATEPPQSSRAKTILKSAGLRPSKSRGQNFLTQGAIADRIVTAANLSASDEVVEIGPGLAILSERILRAGVRRLILVELDRALAERLRETFSGDTRVIVVEADFLTIDLRSLASGRAKIIGNLPFNAAGAIFRMLCDHHDLISTIVAMFQREVGERIRAKPGDPDYSAMSVYAALYFDIDLHFRVSAGSFHPKPKVDAEVIRFRPRKNPLFESSEEARVLAAVRASFSAPRKMIRNSLAGALHIGSEDAARALERAGINSTARAESLSPEDFVRLARALESV
jgi:16S rRNA (adenine1518-N6/adenine1519-N6)-dimethyltransferase